MASKLHPISTHAIVTEKRARQLESHIHVAKSSEELSVADAETAISRIASVVELDAFVPAKERQAVIDAAMSRRKELIAIENLRKK